MKTMHVTCDSEDTRPDGSVHRSLSHLLSRLQLFQKMLSCWQIQTLFIPPHSAHCLSAAFSPASVSPFSCLCVLHFVTTPALLHPLPWPSGLPLPPGAPRLLHLPLWKSFQTLPWLLWLFLSAIYHCVTLAEGVTQPLQDWGSAGEGNHKTYLGWREAARWFFCLAGPGSPARWSLLHWTDWSCLATLW